MAFSTSSLSALGYDDGFTLWHYKAGADALDAVTAPGFFEDEASMFAPATSGPGGASRRRSAISLYQGEGKRLTW